MCGGEFEDVSVPVNSLSDRSIAASGLHGYMAEARCRMNSSEGLGFSEIVLNASSGTPKQREHAMVINERPRIDEPSAQTLGHIDPDDPPGNFLSAEIARLHAASV